MLATFSKSINRLPGLDVLRLTSFQDGLLLLTPTREIQASCKKSNGSL